MKANFVDALFQLSVLILEWSFVSGHVSLTFPPARKYQLDFLDTLRTASHCGMYKGKIKTIIPTNQDITITWSLTYPHEGGFKLELLDANEAFVTDLTPKGQYIGTENKTIQEYNLKIPPNLNCSSCTIRFLRQALEYDSDFKFMSCADVEIVNDIENSVHNECSGHGKVKAKACKCDKTYYGSQCQYKNDCEDSEDCNHNGKCIKSEGLTIPQKECYCKPGSFGQHCEKHSQLKEKVVRPELYTEVKFPGDKIKFFWRTIIDGNKREIEGVIIANTTSYLGIGWRPSKITKSCRKFPEDAPPPTAHGDFSILHPMDCQDIIIAKVKGDGSNIGDYYTRDRSTPKRDSFYGGDDDLTAAIGWEVDGVTTIMFRKPVFAEKDNFQDHDFDGSIKLIWAYGQKDDHLYGDNLLKYHGKNRGFYTLNIDAASTARISPNGLLFLFSYHWLVYCSYRYNFISLIMMIFLHSLVQLFFLFKHLFA